MPATRAEKTMRAAAKRAPATITKQHRGQPSRKSFKAWTVTQLLETYRDPRAVLLEIASTDTAILATTLNCSMQDALAERRLCAQAALPYVAAKMPVMVDMRHTRAIALNIVDERQYQQLVEAAATTDDTESFNMTLLGTATDDSETTGDRPVTPPTDSTPTGRE
jgi:hypothetical protein